MAGLRSRVDRGLGVIVAVRHVLRGRAAPSDAASPSASVLPPHGTGSRSSTAERPPLKRQAAGSTPAWSTSPRVPFSIVTLVVACRVAHTRANSEGHADAEGHTDEDCGAEADSDEDTSTDADHPQAVAEPDADDEEADSDRRSDGQRSGPPGGVLLAAWRLRLHR